MWVGVNKAVDHDPLVQLAYLQGVYSLKENAKEKWSIEIQELIDQVVAKQVAKRLKQTLGQNEEAQ